MHTPFLIVVFLLSIFSSAYAADGRDAFRSTEFPLPRFVSIAVGEVFVRAGPGLKFPVKWVLKKKKMPVEIVLEYDNWRKIRDVDGDQGGGSRKKIKDYWTSAATSGTGKKIEKIKKIKKIKRITGN